MYCVADAALPFLTEWSNFFVMTGTSAATLTGLMFVVLTLVSRASRRSRQDGIATFSTPTVAHFCTALYLSAVLAAPWRSLPSVSVLLAIAGLYGIVYILHIVYRTRRLEFYVADLEDWIWYTVLPFTAYIAIFASAIGLLAAPARTLFVLAGAVIVLIFIGIRNSWDIVTYIASGRADEPERADRGNGNESSP